MRLCPCVHVCVWACVRVCACGGEWRRRRAEKLPQRMERLCGRNARQTWYMLQGGTE